MNITNNLKTPLVFGLASAAVVTGLSLASMAETRAAGSATVIDITQTGCQFVESEKGIDHGYSPKAADDCKAINAKDGEKRLASSEVLHLKAGDYVFRVTNKNVPYELGFWLRGDGIIGRTTLPSVSGGGLTAGTTQDYAVTLEPGEYVYSCPLNPTPDYKLIVEG